MKYTQLGKRGPNISTIGFGAWAIGGMNWGKTDDSISKRALNEALDRGVTLIDTADVYGFGHSEKLIAEVIKEQGKGDIIIATKAGNDFYHSSKKDDRGYGPIRQNVDRNYIIWAAEQSLKRLGVNVIDIFQLHSPDTEKLKQSDPWEALDRLKQQGKIKHAGWSVQSFKETEQAFLLDQYHELIDCIQVRYNLLEREAEQELLPRAQKYGTGVIVRIPLLFGLLTGKFNRHSQFGEDDHRRFNLSSEKLDKYLSELEQLQSLFDRYPNQTMTQISLRFCISHPGCHTAIPGAKTSQQVADNCAAADYDPIPMEEIQQLVE